MGKEFYSLIRSFGGLSLEYVLLSETDFSSAAGSAYVPPERGVFRRIAGSRQIQILQDCPGVIETFQTSDAELFLPSNTVGIENDAGDGRLFLLKNSGTGAITVKDYAGNLVLALQQAGHIIIVGNDNNNWDYYFDAEGIKFVDPDFVSSNVGDAIREAKQNAEGFPRAGARSTYNGTVSNNDWLGPDNLLPDVPLLVLPVKTKLNEITWANRRNNVAFRIQFRRNSRTGPIVYTLDVNSPNDGFGFVTDVDVFFDPGDTIHAQYLDDGRNASDLDLILWISRVPEV